MPQRDHTTNSDSGSYVYFETSNKKTGSKATLYGPMFSSSYCIVRFYYYIYGKSAGKLTFYYRTAVGGPFIPLWSKAGSISQNWERAEATFHYLNTNIQIIIEAEIETESKDDGVIAIDDISFTNQCLSFNGNLPTIITTTTKSPCGPNGFICPSGPCIDNSQICNFIKDCPNGEDEANCGTCDFENGSCGWYDDSFGDHFWNRTTADLTIIPNDSLGEQK